MSFFSYSFGDLISIKFKVNEDLITNYDIVKEAKYLTALNSNLNNLDKNQVLELAKNSLIKEKIKKHEIEKYYNVNYESEAVDTFINDIMKKNGFEDKLNFEMHLISNESNLDELRKKLIIERTWNKMIFDIYQDRIKINEQKISKTLEDLINKKKIQKSFYIKEIVFSEKNKEDFIKKYNEIILSIQDLGFEKTALIFSISDTSKDGGKIGWVNQNQLSKKFLDLLNDLEIGSYTAPITTAGRAMILQLNDIKDVSMQGIDKELELSNIVSSEKNRQLNEFSVIHFKKTESKSYVKKF